jgi:hypothetical protein
LETLSVQFPRDDLQAIIGKMSQEGLLHFDGEKLALEA